jgi:hypothetical protein
MLGGVGAPHRLLIGGKEAGALLGGRLRARDEVDRVAGFEVAANLAAVAGTALRRQLRVADLDDVALGGVGEGGGGEDVADESAY